MSSAKYRIFVWTIKYNANVICIIHGTVIDAIYLTVLKNMKDNLYADTPAFQQNVSPLYV